MTTVRDILNFINTIAPPYMKEDWDHVGLNVGHLDAPVSKILVALDPFEAVCHEAKAIGAQLIVTHHALLWEPGFITDETQQGKNALYLIENRIAHINAHTNLDCAPGGVNDVLADALGLSEIEVIRPQGKDALGRPWGLLRKGTVKEQSLENFLANVKSSLGTPRLHYASAGRPVRNVAVGGGACGSEISAAKESGCDTFVTADLKYNHFWDAQALGINLIDAGHFYTENPVCGYLVSVLQAAFPDIQILSSQTHKDCALFF